MEVLNIENNNYFIAADWLMQYLTLNKTH